MKILIELMETAQPIEVEAVNSYTKGPLFCVYLTDGRVMKFPVAHLFRVTETYR